MASLSGESNSRLGGQLRDAFVLFFSYNYFPLGEFFQTHLGTGLSQDFSANKQPRVAAGPATLNTPSSGQWGN